MTHVSGMLVVSAVVGSVFSALWFKCIQWMRGRVVLVSVATNVALSLACAILYFSTNQAGAAVPFIIAVVWILIWITWNRHRIPLAEATLAAASKSLSDNWSNALHTHNANSWILSEPNTDVACVAL